MDLNRRPHVSPPTPGRLVALVAALALLSVALTGCHSDWRRQMSMDSDFSINVATLPIDWPDNMEDLTMAEQDVVRSYGRPDFVRVWWTSAGDFINQTWGHRRTLRNEVLPDRGIKQTWVYLHVKGGTEIYFQGDLNHVEEPLTDELRLICTMGDPDERSAVQNTSGRRIEDWIYLSRGHRYRFVDGVKVKENRSLPAMPGYSTR